MHAFPFGRFFRFLLLLVLTHQVLPAQDLLQQAEEAGVYGGLAVIIGDAGEPAQALARSGRFVVHILASAPLETDRLRARVLEARLAGEISVHSRTPDGPLPYARNGVNLIVDKAGLPAEDLMRVMAPGGLLVCGGRTFSKP